MDFILIEIMVVLAAIVVGALGHHLYHRHTPTQALLILTNAYCEIEEMAKKQGFDVDKDEAGLEVKATGSDGRVYVFNMKVE